MSEGLEFSIRQGFMTGEHDCPKANAESPDAVFKFPTQGTSSYTPNPTTNMFSVETDDDGNVTYKIKNVACIIGRELREETEDKTFQKASAVYLHISHTAESSGAPTIAIDVVTAAGSNSQTDTYIKLYSFDDDMNVVVDYRMTPVVPLYE